MLDTDEVPSLAPVNGHEHSHFDVLGLPIQQQLLAWRERVGHVIDVSPSLAQLEQPFQGSIDRYKVGEWTFTDCICGPLTLQRSIARISTDSLRDYVFQIFIQGQVSFESDHALTHGQQCRASIVALDLNQPASMQRSACRVLSLFAPRASVEAVFPHAESLHGRILENTTALTQLLIEQMAGLATTLPRMSTHEVGSVLENSIQLLLAAFAKQAKLSGNARAAARAAMLDQARRYVKANLHHENLSPESLLLDLQLPRATLYRLFEHEGGLAAYIRRCRLREAADELVKWPKRPVTDVAYGLGFGSASDFTRAFRRLYGMAPLDFRITALRRLIDLTPTRRD